MGRGSLLKICQGFKPEMENLHEITLQKHPPPHSPECLLQSLGYEEEELVLFAREEGGGCVVSPAEEGRDFSPECGNPLYWGVERGRLQLDVGWKTWEFPG